jgi:hypothetical protein
MIPRFCTKQSKNKQQKVKPTKEKPFDLELNPV